MFKRFLNPIRRTPAVEDPAALLATARSHQDPVIRRDACRRLRDLPALLAILIEDGDAGVREFALAHYRNLLCGLDEQPIAEELRVRALADQQDPRILEHVATTAREPIVRQAAIGRLTNQTVLAGCAIHDGFAANRVVATAMIEDRTVLESVARQIGKRDKNVHRLVRQKLKAINEREELPRRARALCDELCEKLERLGRFDTWSQDLALLAHMDRQWAEMEPHADAAARERYAGLRSRLLDAYAAHREAHAAEIAAEEAHAARLAERRELLDTIDQAAALEDEAAIAAACTQVAERWEALEPLPEAEQAALGRRYDALIGAAQRSREALRARRKSQERIGKLLATAEQTLGQAKPLDHKAAQRLNEQAEAILKAVEIPPDLCQDFDAARKALDARLAKQRKHAAQRLQDVPERLAELEQHLAAGELKPAEPLLQSLQAILDLAAASGLPRGDHAPAAARLHALAPRIRELQQWRKWGADQHRQGLQEAVEALETADITMEAVSLRLHDIQMEWKGLDQGGSPVNHALWDRFHAACERVYERCRPYLEEQAKVLEANRVQRQQVCQDLEDFLDKVDWERMDWKKAVRAERETRRAWADLGQVEPRKRRALEKRFRAALARLDERIEAERARNLRFREDLIARVEALVEEPDLEGAMEQTKHLQRDWHTTVPGRQRDENRLWTRFRAACDAVFARRRSQQEAQHAEFAGHLASREALCTEARALAEGDLSPEDLTRALRDLDGRWREAEALPVPRQAAAGLAQRWREAREAVDQTRRARLAAIEHGQRDLLVQQAQLCNRLEQALLAGTVEPAALDALSNEWAALGSLRDDAMQQTMTGRLEAALAAAQGDSQAQVDFQVQVEANQRERRSICLQLEVLAQVESPPELAQERMELQVARLTGHMAAGESDPLAGAEQLLSAWYRCGPFPADDALEARFERARFALALAGAGGAAP